MHRVSKENHLDVIYSAGYIPVRDKSRVYSAPQLTNAMDLAKLRGRDRSFRYEMSVFAGTYTMKWFKGCVHCLVKAELPEIGSERQGWPGYSLSVGRVRSTYQLNPPYVWSAGDTALI